MARIHSPKRGSSHSTRPVMMRTPSWVTYSPEEVESMIIKFAKEGHSPDKIGMILRDQHGIPLAKSLLGRSISKVAKGANLSQKVPDDLTAILRRANRMQRHIAKNPGDRRNVHNMQLLESRIHRLSKFYKSRGILPQDWKYKPVVGSFI